MGCKFDRIWNRNIKKYGDSQKCVCKIHREVIKRELNVELWNALHDKWAADGTDDFYNFGMKEVFDEFFKETHSRNSTLK